MECTLVKRCLPWEPPFWEYCRPHRHTTEPTSTTWKKSGKITIDERVISSPDLPCPDVGFLTCFESKLSPPHWGSCEAFSSVMKDALKSFRRHANSAIGVIYA